MTPAMRHAGGLAAEEAAERAFAARGAAVIARRWATRGGEIDLILREGGTLVFVEVRARRDATGAAASVTPAKLVRLHRAIAAWLQANDLSPDTPLRLDAALVARDGSIEIVTLGP